MDVKNEKENEESFYEKDEDKFVFKVMDLFYSSLKDDFETLKTIRTSVIFDLDDTLVHYKEGKFQLHPTGYRLYKWFLHIQKTLLPLLSIHIISARQENYRKETENILKEFNIDYRSLDLMKIPPNYQTSKGHFLQSVPWEERREKIALFKWNARKMIQQKSVILFNIGNEWHDLFYDLSSKHINECKHFGCFVSCDLESLFNLKFPLLL